MRSGLRARNGAIEPRGSAAYDYNIPILFVRHGAMVGDDAFVRTQKLGAPLRGLGALGSASLLCRPGSQALPSLGRTNRSVACRDLTLAVLRGSTSPRMILRATGAGSFGVGSRASG